MCVLWNIILQRFQKSSILLQSTSINVENAVALFLALETFITEVRENFDKLLHEARNLIPDVKQELATIQTRRRRRKHQADESREHDANLGGAQKFRVETFHCHHR